MSTNKYYLFEEQILPDGFIFPQSYLDLLESGLPDIEPWWWLSPHKDSASFWLNTMREQFPERMLIPFAKDGSSDDIACFDGKDISGSPKILWIHAFCEPGWEHRGTTDTFIEWLEEMKKISVEFKMEND